MISDRHTTGATANLPQFNVKERQCHTLENYAAINAE
jgi:hypothetical protein